jgi:hypothetical protein
VHLCLASQKRSVRLCLDYLYSLCNGGEGTRVWSCQQASIDVELFDLASIENVCRDPLDRHVSWAGLYNRIAIKTRVHVWS